MIECLWVLGEVNPLAAFSAVIESHHRPTLIDVGLVDGGCPHPSVNVEQTGRILEAVLDRIFAVDTDLFPENPGAQVGFPIQDSILHAFVNDFLLPLPGIGVVLRPDLGRRTRGLCQTRQTEDEQNKQRS